MAARQPGQEKHTRSAHSELLQRSLDDDYLTVVPLEDALDPEAFTTEQRVREPWALSHSGGGRPHQGWISLVVEPGPSPLRPQAGHPRPAAQLLVSWVTRGVLPPQGLKAFQDSGQCCTQPALTNLLQRLLLVQPMSTVLDPVLGL